VDLRITQDSTDPTRLRVDGRLARERVQVLERECRQSGVTAIDLAGLRSADVAGATLLHTLRAGGVRLEGLSPYIELLLERVCGPSSVRSSEDETARSG
jgi:ABC-type transporter Mla MlaB component